jgi:hypothetical protein
MFLAMLLSPKKWYNLDRELAILNVLFALAQLSLFQLLFTSGMTIYAKYIINAIGV